MRAKDIQVGEQYERRPLSGQAVGNRLVVIEVGKIERRVYDGTRAGFGGHTSDAVAVRAHRLERDGTVMRERYGDRAPTEVILPPGQIVRPWAEAEQALTAHEQREAGLQAAISRLDEAVGSVFTVSQQYDRASMRRLHGITVTATLRPEQVDEFLDRVHVSN